MVLEQLKSTNGHASWNVLKRQQSLIDHTPITLTLFPNPGHVIALPLMVWMQLPLLCFFRSYLVDHPNWNARPQSRIKQRGNCNREFWEHGNHGKSIFFYVLCLRCLFIRGDGSRLWEEEKIKLTIWKWLKNLMWFQKKI